MRLALLALLAAATASAQPVRDALPRLGGPELAVAGPSAVVLAPADWEPPPALVAAGIALDGVLLVGGTVVAVWMAVAISDALPEAGLAAPAVIGMGGLFVIGGTALAVVGGLDLIRVARGDDPFLARLFDPTRPRRGRPPPRFPPPGRPPWSPPRY
jgi:hypothetical protein